MQARMADLPAIRPVRDDLVQRNPRKVVIASPLRCPNNVRFATAWRGSWYCVCNTSVTRLRPSLPGRRPSMRISWPLFPRGHEVFPRLVRNRDRVSWRYCIGDERAESTFRVDAFIVKRTSF